MNSDFNNFLINNHEDEILGLVLRVENHFKEKEGRIIQFISPGSEAGTASVSWKFALASSHAMKRKVLFLTGIDPKPLILAANGSNAPGYKQQSKDPAVYGDEVRGISTRNETVKIGRLPTDNESIAELVKYGRSSAIWKNLWEDFDQIVIDSPSPQISYVGQSIATIADGIIIVIEAETTRTQVAVKFLNDLRSLKANVIGTILNNRRYYVPAAIYNLL